MNPRKTQPLKIRVPSPPPTSPPAMTIKQVNRNIGTITQNQRELIEALRATVEANERQQEKHAELVSAHANLAQSQADLNAKIDNLVSRLGDWIDTLQAADGAWKTAKFIAKVTGVLAAIAGGLMWALGKAPPPTGH